MILDELQQTLHHSIPLTQAMGIRVHSFTDGTLSLFAPLEKNYNHKSTAFGGSLYSLSVLTGWSLIHLLLQQEALSGHIVIHKSQTRFLKPVDGNLLTRCQFESEKERLLFLKTYRRKGIARIKLNVHLSQENIPEPQLLFTGEYVVHR
ncbi:YiiD C-terminal domain-containing protein [Thiomicrorhabdus sp.]|uniref:YiiD C-terminal domain-containing protein n=1 Tax=Thiomicrorhabdus sp. TaxID=2039724 RepID=UPI0029C611EE|nr:YiiD C-terminal domain-containing protein [Thiomicrorhabdus sp.]